MNILQYMMESLETEAKHMKNYVTFSESALNYAIAKIPWEFLRFCSFLKFPEELGKFPESPLIFHGKAISLSFPECMGTLHEDEG